MKILSGREWTLLAIIFVLSFLPTFGGLLRVVELSGGVAVLPENPRATAAPLPIVLHILASFVFCLFGALQFMPSIRRRAPAFHRAVGRIVVVAGTLSALAGLWMTQVFSFPEGLQGSLLYGTRLVLGVSMVALIIWAMIAIGARNIPAHGAAMLRAYAIGQGAATQTVLGAAWMIAVGSESTGLPRDMLIVTAWGLNLLIAEYVIRRTFLSRSPRRYASASS